MFQTNRLLVVGGVSAAGKSTLLEKIYQGEVPHLCRRLNIVIPSSYVYCSAKHLSEVTQPTVERLALHYDFLYQYSPKDSFTYLPDIIRRSSSVSVLTLCTSHEVLFRRLTQRLKGALISFLCGPSTWTAKRILSLWRTREFYRSYSNLFEHYIKWAEFIAGQPVDKHLFFDNTNHRLTTAMPYEKNQIKIRLRMLLEQPAPC